MWEAYVGTAQPNTAWQHQPHLALLRLPISLQRLHHLWLLLLKGLDEALVQVRPARAGAGSRSP